MFIQKSHGHYKSHGQPLVKICGNPDPVSLCPEFTPSATVPSTVHPKEVCDLSCLSWNVDHGGHALSCY